jgi:GT2 family glycosyltransferase
VSDVTVLLLSVDEAGMLAHALPAALAQDGARVVVVDNACTDDTAAVARALGADVLTLPERLSYAAAMNVALERTGGDTVLFLNADCFLEPGFLAAARPRLDEENVGSVAPRLLRTEGPDGDALAIDGAGMTVDRRRKNGLVGHGRPLSAYTRAADAFGADGAAALYRREVLDRCALPPAPGGSGAAEVFDEAMALWASDADLAWRMRLLGWRCVYEPGAVARHVRTYSPSTRPHVAESHRRLQFRNRYLMWFKNETRRDLLRHLPWIVAYEIAAFAYVLLRERHLLAGYRELRTLMPGARRRRRLVQERRAGARVPFGLAPPE